MADLSREHNSSPMPGVRPNPDPALDISHEHHHGHLHHSANAERGHTEHDQVAYTTGTTFNEPAVIPKPDPNDESYHRHGHVEHDTEKSGGLEFAEKGSLSKGEASSEPEIVEEHRGFFWLLKNDFRGFYRRYRIFFHIFIGALFTG
jgi:CNT family concentrative nucleoside transporter